MKRSRCALVLFAASGWAVTLNIDGATVKAGFAADGRAPADQSAAPAANADRSGRDTDSPHPIDRGGDPGAPRTYKGLPLQLTDNGEPKVTPVDGVIGVVCIGMSNSTQECQDYVQKVAGPFAAEITAAVRVVDCAVGGRALEQWIDPAVDSRLWDACLTQKLAKAGVRPDQVRVLYHKAANQYTASANETPYPPYPSPDSDYLRFYKNLTAFSARVPQKFPSAQAVYTTSRSYGGFAKRAHRGEPLSYEEGHALNKWLADSPSVSGVWYGWGPYIWAPDCATNLTNRDGICYVRSDYRDDGIHPAQGAKNKISALIHARLKQHAWYVR